MTGQQLKNSILQLAIQGKLVPQDPNDEPASKLLARIRKEKEQLVKNGKLKKKDLVTTPITDEEKPFEIPESWEWCRLGEIGSWGSGATPAKGRPEYYTNGIIPWLRTGELNNGHVYDSEIKVTQAALDNCSLRMCKKGDVLIAMYGATIGKVAIADIEMTTNQACCACTPILLYNEYLMLYLMASKQAFIELGEGGAQPNISREKIIVFPFAVPPLAEQHRIVEKIEELMPLVEQYGKSQEKLEALNKSLPEALKKSILQEAIMGRLVPQDPTEEPASALLARIRKEKEQLVKEGKLKKKDLITTPITDEEKPFDIPESWEWCRLGEIGSWGSGATPAKGKPEYYSNGTIPWLRTGELNNGHVYDSEIKVTRAALDNCSLRMCKKGDVLIAMYGATIGKVAIADIELTTNQACCACTPIQLYNEYLLLYLMASKQAFIELGEGGAQPNISREKIVAFPFAVPPLDEQHRIVVKIEELFEIIK